MMMAPSYGMPQMMAPSYPPYGMPMMAPPMMVAPPVAPPPAAPAPAPAPAPAAAAPAPAPAAAAPAPEPEPSMSEILFPEPAPASVPAAPKPPKSPARGLLARAAPTAASRARSRAKSPTTRDRAFHAFGRGNTRPTSGGARAAAQFGATLAAPFRQESTARPSVHPSPPALAGFLHGDYLATFNVKAPVEEAPAYKPRPPNEDRSGGMQTNYMETHLRKALKEPPPQPQQMPPLRVDAQEGVLERTLQVRPPPPPPAASAAAGGAVVPPLTPSSLRRVQRARSANSLFEEKQRAAAAAAKSAAPSAAAPAAAAPPAATELSANYRWLPAYDPSAYGAAAGGAPPPMSGAPMPLPTQNTGWVPRALGDERAPKRFLGSHPAVLRAIPAAGVRKKRIDDKDMRKVWNPEDN